MGRINTILKYCCLSIARILDLTHYPRNPFTLPRAQRLYIVILALGSVFSHQAAAVDPVPGFTPGEFSVDQGGASTYTIPIAVPPGTAGMQPALSLSYNSRAGDGVLGLGWTLGGLSVITRCPTQRAIDGLTLDGVDFDANDRFCIDGQRLVAISGVYGSDSTEYRTETDALTKVISYGSVGGAPEKFKVFTKSGQIMEYGYTSDARIEAQGAHNGAVRIWAVNKIADTVGNYITVTYFEDTANGEYRPVQLDYTLNDNASLAAYASVQFIYAARTDVRLRYFANALVKNSVQLSNIKTYYGQSLVKDYQFSYDNNGAAGRLRLTSVKECDASTNCFAPTTFTWREAPTGIPYALPIVDVNHPQINRGDENYFWVDFNGDEFVDYVKAEPKRTRVRLNNRDGTFTPEIESSHNTDNQDTYVAWADVNGDGKTDWTRSQGAMLRVRLGVGDGTFTLPIVDSNHGVSSQNTNFSWVDVNADGWADWVRAQSSTTRVRLSLGDGTFGPIIDDNHNNSADNSSGVTWLDMNGDGYPDWVRAANNDIRVRLGTGDGHFAPMQINTFSECTSGCGYNTNVVFADINGDGLPDWVRKSWVSEDSTKIKSRLALGDGTFAPTVSSSIDYLMDDDAATFFDMNGDGLADCVRTTSSKIHVRFSLGNQDFSPTYESAHGTTSQDTKVSWADINGDGLPDWIRAKPTFFRYRLSENVIPDLLLTVTNGLGHLTEVNYQPMTNTSVYTKGTAALYPVFDLIGAVPLVSSVKVSNGLPGGLHETTYSYSQVKADVLGRGNLGFQTMTAVDVPTGIKTTTTYSQTHPFIGFVSRTEQRQSNNSLLGETDTTFASLQTHVGTEAIPGHPGVLFPYATQVITKDYELNGALIKTATTTNVYDSYGNPTDITVALTGNNPSGQSETYTTRTLNTYTNTEANWILGRLTRAEVIQTSPDTTTPSPSDTVSAIRVSAFEYNANGLLTREVIEPDQASLKLTTDYSYDGYGNKTGATVSGLNITSRTTTTVFDVRGRFATSVTNALGHTETHAFNEVLGVPISLTGPNNLTTSWSYDTFGRQNQETRADGTTTVVTRQWCNGYLGNVGNTTCPTGGALAQTTQVSGAPTTTAYSDFLGREVRVATQGFDGTAIYVDTQYNALGEITQKSRPYFAGGTVYWNVFTYDLLGRALTATAPDNSVTTSSYNGLSTAVTNALNQTNTRIMNVRGDLAEVRDATYPTSQFVTNYHYDPFGNLIKVVDAANNAITNTYDIRGRKTATNDPDMGSWTYQYNVLGELIAQTDAKAQTVAMTYDLLGRMLSRTEPEGVSTWVYDTAPYGIGKLHTSTGAEGDSRTVAYDSFGRVVSTTTTLGVHTFTVSQSYDAASRVNTLTYPASPHYPTGLVVQNQYNALGYLTSVRNVSNNLVYWQATEMNAEGQLTRFELGNGVRTQHAYTPQTGLLFALGSTSTGASNDIQDLGFTFDAIGNLTQRQNYALGLNETFAYDVLNRLTGTTLTNGGTPLTTNYTYDALGNITYKSDIGTYSYGQNGAGAHAVTTAGGRTLGYDANGNQTSGWNFKAGKARTLSYSSYNKPQDIQQLESDGVTLAAHLTFAYDSDRTLFKQKNELTGKTTLYLGDLYEHETAGSLITHTHYIKAGGVTVAQYRSRSNATEDTRYLHRDHLGSITALTDATAQMVEQLSFDAHGQRRNINGTPSVGPLTALETLRGFTGHRQLDDVGLIHMGGRVYDPDLGRFLSPDPFIQEPANAQNLNRYSYVLNNPLSYTDPSGFFFSSIFKAITKAFKAVVGFLKNNLRLIGAALAGVVGYVICGPICSGFAFGMVSSGGDLKTGIISAITAYAFYQIGTPFGEVTSFTEHVLKSVANGVVGGVFNVAQGGDFLSGFAAAGFAQFVGGSSFVTGLGPVTEGIVRTVVGGVSSVLGGGKFKNGAVTAGFAYAFGSFVRSGQATQGLPQQATPEGVLGSALDVIGKIWALPNTIIGTVIGLAGVPFGATISFGNNGIQFENYPWGSGALTLGNAIIYGGGASPAQVGQLYGDSRFLNVGLHEMGHTYQYQVLGPLFLPTYFFAGGISATNPFERAANNYAGGGGWWPK